jgi:hypothetical protein
LKFLKWFVSASLTFALCIGFLQIRSKHPSLSKLETFTPLEVPSGMKMVDSVDDRESTIISHLEFSSPQQMTEFLERNHLGGGRSCSARHRLIEAKIIQNENIIELRILYALGDEISACPESN